MNCFTCGTRTVVKNSRNADSPKGHSSNLINRARSAVSDQTSEWVARERTCAKCNTTTATIEIPMDDLIAGWKPRDLILKS